MTQFKKTTGVLFLVLALVIASGTAMSFAGTPAETGPDVIGEQETTTGEQNETTTTEQPSTQTPSETTTSEASYTQTPHMGCQPGAIEKNGTCQSVTSGSNADIFSGENLMAITATNTTINGTPGYLARPADDGKYPSVIMIHEWWGLNQNIRHMPDILAGHGYVVFAVDLYDGRVATNSSTASELASEVRNNPDEAVAKMSRATAGIRDRPYTTKAVASLGWCFGGGQSLQLSLSEAELNATVIYYGTLTTNESVSSTKRWRSSVSRRKDTSTREPPTPSPTLAAKASNQRRPKMKGRNTGASATKPSAKTENKPKSEKQPDSTTEYISEVVRLFA